MVYVKKHLVNENSSKNLRATPRYIPYAVEGDSDRLCKYKLR